MQVPEHAELCWILGCHVTMPRLKQLPQFKEKSSKLKDVPLGLFVYPVLQSADILCYRATEVPVGEDQLQHIQLAQHLARLLNNKYGNLFPVPSPLLENSQACRIKSLRDPRKKMSKSDVDLKSRIELLDSEEIIMEKFKKAITDNTSEVSYHPETRPGVSNLIDIHHLVSGKSINQICLEAKGLETAQYKLLVGSAVAELLKPIRTSIVQLYANPDYLEQVLRVGHLKAREIASCTLKDVKQALGLGFP